MIRVYFTFLFFAFSLVSYAGSFKKSPLKAVSHVKFTENKSQWKNSILFQADFKGGKLFLEQKEITYLFYEPALLSKVHPHSPNEKEDIHDKNLKFHSVKVKLAGMNPDCRVAGENITTGYSNYYVGKDKSKWAGGVRSYKEVVYKEIYPAIDLKIYSQQNNIKYDYIVQPHASPDSIKMQLNGADSLYLRNDDLIIETSVGEIMDQKPFAYQVIHGKNISVPCKYTLSGQTLGFSFPKGYNHDLPLVIDPTLIFSTFSGSLEDNWGMTATYDGEGNAYSAGLAFGMGYPTTTGAFQTTFAGGGTGGNSLGGYPFEVDIVISKFSADGSQMLFSTYYGGSDNEQPQSLIVNSKNELLVYGRTYSPDFPVTSGSYDTLYNSGSDIIVGKFNASGTSLLASTYFGGAADDGVNITSIEAVLGSLKYNYSDDGRGEIIIDGNDNVYVTSSTQSADFPTSANAFKKTRNGMQDACVFKLNSSLSSLVWSTYLGGSSNDAGYSLALDKNSNVFITGGTASTDFPVTAGVLNPVYQGGRADGFVARLKNDGSALLQSTYIGTGGYDQSYFVQTDNMDQVYLYGQTDSLYPVSANVYSNPNSGQFIHKLNATLSVTRFSTVFGSGKGSPDISPSAFLVDKCQNIYISGWGGSLGGQNNSASSTNNLPVTTDAYQSVTDGSDFYFLALQKDAQSLWYATYFGGPTTDEHVDGGTSRFDKSGVIYQAVCGGCGGISDMPTTPGVWSNTNNSYNCNNALIKFKFDLINTVAVFLTDPPTGAGCAPFKVAFKNNSINAKEYKWDFGDGGFSSEINPAHTYTAPGKYKIRLIATNYQTCNIHDTTYNDVEVFSLQIPQQPDTFICAGNTVQLNASGGLNYLWSPAAGLDDPAVSNPVAAPVVNTTYIVKITGTYCETFDTVSVSVLDKSPLAAFTKNVAVGCTPANIDFKNTSKFGTGYEWNFGDGTNATAINPSHLYTQAGSYKISLIAFNDECNFQDTTFQLIDVHTFQIPKANDTTICSGEKVQLSTVQDVNYSYMWAPQNSLNDPAIANPVASPETSTPYTVKVSNAYCDAFDTILVTVYPNKQPAIVANKPSTICETDSITLDAGAGYNSYQWSNGKANRTITVKNEGFYTVTTISNDLCLAKDSILVSVVPAMVFKHSTDTTLCSGNPVQLHASGGTTYSWSPEAGLNNASIPDPVANIKATTTFLVKVSNAGCSDSANIKVTILPTPFVKASADNSIVESGTSVQLHASGDSVYSWKPGYGLSCYTCSNPKASIDSTIKYYVTVKNNYGCYYTDSLLIEADYQYTLYVPNCVTINEDGFNELFKPEFENLLQINCEIFDRWGELIYEWTDLEGSWDGTYKGKPVQQDIYVYKINAVTKKKNRIRRSGTVTVIR